MRLRASSLRHVLPALVLGALLILAGPVMAQSTAPAFVESTYPGTGVTAAQYTNLGSGALGDLRNAMVYTIPFVLAVMVVGVGLWMIPRWLARQGKKV